MQATPQQRDWRIERLRLANPDGTLNLDGTWQAWLTQPATQVNVRLDVSDVGKYLTRLGYPEGVRRGTATYWVEADKSLLPATGPGLICTEGKPAPKSTAASEVETPADAPTSESTTIPTTEAVTTGRISIQVHACDMTAESAMASAETDWYGDCAHDGTTYRFQLESVDNGETRVTATTDSEGLARFNELDPGRYRLTLVDLDWCHAESDAVDAEGLVQVKAGGTASVWIFVCGADA